MRGSDITDILLRDDYIYLLFETHTIDVPGKDGNFYTVGGLIRCKTEKRGDGWTVKASESFGLKKSPDFERRLIKPSYYDNNFYGPVKFIGFDENFLYIADDGVSFAEISTGAVVKANNDRIAKFRFADEGPSGERLAFGNAPGGITWIVDKKIKPTAAIEIIIGD